MQRFWAAIFISGLLATGMALLPADARACQYSSCQSSGAVNLPSGFELSLPFEDGEEVYLHSGYGPSGGSSLHCRATDSSCANDWHALDLTLPDYPNGGMGQPVVASASGTVISAGWGTQGWKNYGRRVYIEHDFNGDGHTYITMYAHLDSISVAQGQHVDKGQRLGTLGSSCQNQDSCSSFGSPHLHWSVHQDSNFGGSGSGGSYGGRAVKPEPIDGYTGLQQGQTLTSQNGGSSDPDPDPDPDPSTCDTPIPASGGWVEENSGCAETVGDLSDASGHDGHAYVGTMQSPDPDYAHGVIYKLNMAQGGDYHVYAHIPSGVGNLTGEAVYKIAATDGSTKVSVDQQSHAGGEVDLGVFNLGSSAPDSHWVRLGDNYKSGADHGKNFVLDGLRLAPAASGCVCNTDGATEADTCPTGGFRTRTCDGCNWSAWSGCGSNDAGSGGADTGGSNTGGADTGTSGDDAATSESDIGGSGGSGGADGDDTSTSGTRIHANGGCSSVPGIPASPWALVWLVCGLFYSNRKSSTRSG